MKKLIEILRLHYDGKLSQRQIEKSINVSRKTINYYLILFDKSGLSWPLDKQYQNMVQQQCQHVFINPKIRGQLRMVF